MANNGENAIWTPEGVVKLDGKKLAVIELRPTLMEYFVQFALFAQSQRIGWHCADCGKDLIGKNSPNDPTFSMACECREWRGGNRDYRAPKVN